MARLLGGGAVVREDGGRAESLGRNESPGPSPQHPDCRHETTEPREVGPAEETVLHPGFIDL